MEQSRPDWLNQSGYAPKERFGGQRTSLKRGLTPRGRVDVRKEDANTRYLSLFSRTSIVRCGLCDATLIVVSLMTLSAMFFVC